jgi:hypothetical protein
MTDRTKSALLLGAILVLGIVIGSLLTGAIVNRRIDSLAEARGRMSAFFLDAIEPESEEQAEAIREVLEGAAPRFKEIYDNTRSEMRRLRDSVMAELDPILSDLQKERLEERMRFGPRPPFDRQRRPGFRPGPHGPPPGDSGQRRRRPPDAAPDDSSSPGAAVDTLPAGASRDTASP